MNLTKDLPARLAPACQDLAMSGRPARQAGQIKKIEQFVSSKLNSLDWQHTLQVREIALKLARLEKADQAIVEAAALLHDVGKAKADVFSHAQKGGEMTRAFLESHKFEQRFIEEVICAVVAHDYVRQDKPHLISTLEAKVVADSDTLNNLSAIGIIKAAIYNAQKLQEDFSKTVKEIIAKAEKRSGQLLTRSGQALAKEHLKFVKEFYKKLGA